MSFRDYGLEDILWGILSILGTVLAGAFLIGATVLVIAGNIIRIQMMFTEPEEVTVVEGNVK